MSSNQEIIKSTISKYPGLRFHEIKKEINLANGTLQHHLAQLIKSELVNVQYDRTIPRYFLSEINAEDKIIINRLSQNTTSKIVKVLLKKECQTFGQLVKFTKKSPGTVSVYKDMLLKDKIIVGDTNGCKYAKNTSSNKLKYRLVDPQKIRMLVEEYGKTSLKQSADNFADIFLSIK